MTIKSSELNVELVAKETSDKNEEVDEEEADKAETTHKNADTSLKRKKHKADEKDAINNDETARLTSNPDEHNDTDDHDDPNVNHISKNYAQNENIKLTNMNNNTTKNNNNTTIDKNKYGAKFR